MSTARLQALAAEQREAATDALAALFAYVSPIPTLDRRDIAAVVDRFVATAILEIAVVHSKAKA